MTLNLDFNNKSKSPLTQERVFSVVEKTLEENGEVNLEKVNISLSVAVVSEKEIQELNRTYRQKDQSTDVLSFPEYDNFESIKYEISSNSDLFLGELVLCYNDIKTYVEENGFNLENELTKVIAHGVLHLLGFDHGEKMFELQERIVERMKEEK